MFPRNTQDSSGVNPEGKAQRLSRRELINTNRGWFEWLVPLLAYKLMLCFLPLPHSLFYQTGTLRRATSGSGSLILLVVSQQTSHWSLCAFCMPADLSACAVGTGRLLIVRSIYNITGPTNARIALRDVIINRVSTSVIKFCLRGTMVYIEVNVKIVCFWTLHIRYCYRIFLR